MRDISHLQILQTVLLKDTLVKSLHGEAGKHPAISKMMQEIKQKGYFPSIANHVCKWVQKCQSCVQGKRIDNSQITPDFVSVPEWD